MKKALLFLFLALSVACTRKMGFGQWTLHGFSAHPFPYLIASIAFYVLAASITAPTYM